jgi:hypothetical protein
MKKYLTVTLLIICISSLLSSCYSVTYKIGKGSRLGLKVSQKNHYLIYGLAPIRTSNPARMAGSVSDYTVNTQHTFVDGLISALTLGIYSTTTTTVTK